MADGTHIEWTDATWNPITGCSIVSPGCTRCYAMKLAGTRLQHHPSRAGLTVDSKAGPVWTGEVRLNENWLDQPLRWKRPRKIFVCAHGDPFAENVPDKWIVKVVATCVAGWLLNSHTFQILTKRADRMRALFINDEFWEGVNALAADLVRDVYDPLTIDDYGKANPCPGIWLGVSAERQQEADARIPHLLATPATFRFVSAEPLLGQIDFGQLQDNLPVNAWVTWLDGLSQIIVGGESGTGARPMHPAWVRSIRDQCFQAGTAFFFKQWGNWAPQFDATHVEPTHWVFPNGSYRPIVNAEDWPDGGLPVGKVDKKRAGRFLDGLVHDAMPAIAEVPFQ